jgi:hypothetical protein
VGLAAGVLFGFGEHGDARGAGEQEEDAGDGDSCNFFPAVVLLLASTADSLTPSRIPTARADESNATNAAAWVAINLERYLFPKKIDR